MYRECSWVFDARSLRFWFLLQVVIPREDIVGYIDRMVRIAVYLSILILFLSLLLSVLGMRCLWFALAWPQRHLCHSLLGADELQLSQLS